MTFAQKLAEYLEASGKTSQAIANEVGVSGSAVCRWLSGHAMPRIRHLPKVAKALQTTQAVLFETMVSSSEKRGSA